MNSPSAAEPGLPEIVATVLPEWTDYNGHLNVAWYSALFDQATDAVLAWAGLGLGYVQRARASVFVIESHVVYQRELHSGEPVRVEARLLGADAKKLHLFFRLCHGQTGAESATCELLLIHVDLTCRQAAPFPPAIAAVLAAAVQADRRQPAPHQAGRAIRALQQDG